jgi:hypothetical protein
MIRAFSSISSSMAGAFGELNAWTCGSASVGSPMDTATACYEHRSGIRQIPRRCPRSRSMPRARLRRRVGRVRRRGMSGLMMV